MKDLFKSLWILLAVLMLPAGITSCSSDDDDDNNDEEVYAPILEAYVYNTVVPTYKSLAEAALKMRTANEALKNELTDANMVAAANAWMAARIEWELSEAFLFGPVGENAMDIDGHIDSWPLELNDITNTITEIQNNNNQFTGEDAWEKEGDVIGFHVTEYLLYRDGQARPAATVTPAELHYLTAATDALIWDCVLAYVAWVGEDNVSSQMKTVFNENPAVVAHLNANPNYKNFAQKLAGASGIYAGNWKDAFDEISVGATDIADEVGTTKIESPYQKVSVVDVESWYSWHSLDDYKNNIYSIRNAFYGKKGATSPTANSLSSYLAEVNPTMNDNITNKIQDCLDKIDNIGKGGLSFYEVVRDQVNETEVDEAVEACNDLANLFKRLVD